VWRWKKSKSRRGFATVSGIVHGPMLTGQIFLQTFIPLLVAIDPLGVVPVFITVTSSFSEARRRRTVVQSVGVAFTIAIGFIFLGEALFHFLRITVTDFQIAGGILLLVLAILDLLTPGKPSVDEAHTVGIVPLAMPLIAGPATLTTSLMLSRTFGAAPVALALAINFVLLLGVLSTARRLTQLLGVHALTAFSKLVMLLLAAIAVNFIRVGITNAVIEIAAHAGKGQ
jgi:multiple antibiotic resistance protein